MKAHKAHFLIAGICALWLLSLVVTGYNDKRHICGYELCPFSGQRVFTAGCGNCDQGSDCWALDSIHFVYPKWDYDQCEDFLFKGTMK